MNGRDDANLIAPRQPEAGYGSTRASNEASASTSSVRDARTSGDGGSQRHTTTTTWTRSSVHQRRITSSTFVRMNAVDDNTANPRKSEFPGQIDVCLFVLGVWVLLRHWGDEGTKNDPSTSDDEARARDWRGWLVEAVVLKGLITIVCVVGWTLRARDDETREGVVIKTLNLVFHFLQFAKFYWNFTGLQMLGESRSWDNRSDWAFYKLAKWMLIIDYLPAVIFLAVACAMCLFLPCMLALLRSWQRREEQEGARQHEIDSSARQHEIDSSARQHEIDSFPVVKYSEAEGLEEDSCAVCLFDYQAEDELRHLPCKHAFHKLCLDKWLATNRSCPICRALRVQSPDVEENAAISTAGEESV
ncbi:unnamed protein product [Scytosiphon promiscuus]